MQNLITLLLLSIFTICSLNSSASAFQRESKGYMSLNVGFSIDNVKRLYSVSSPSATYEIKGTSYNPAFQGEFGYYILDDLRISINPVYIDSKAGKNSKKTSSILSSSITSKYMVRNTGVFGSVSYDFLTGGTINPFITGGVGVLKIDVQDKLTYSDQTFKASKSTTKLGYKVGGGAAFHINTSMDIELAYNLMNQYKSKKSKKYIDYTILGTNFSAQADTKFVQMLTVGLRYTF